MVSLLGNKRVVTLGGLKIFYQKEQINLKHRQARFSTFIFRTDFKTGADPELDYEGASDSFYCLFHVKTFLIQLFAIENIAIWRGHGPLPLGFTPVYRTIASQISSRNIAGVIVQTAFP